ncbi:MAG: phosphatidate cytidylyltransferase [Deltaproteobacteria bacterium]|nr:phosphatidate cytidylyltransferase [Deltaproteobacteria bacterium]
MLKRIITAVVGIPLVVFILTGTGVTVFALCMFGITGLALYEYYCITVDSASPAERWVGIVLGGLVFGAACLGLLFFAGGPHGAVSAAVAACVLSAFVLFIYYAFFDAVRGEMFSRMAFSFTGVFLIGFLLFYIVLLRSAPGGAQLVLLLFIITWAGDTGAYFAGTWIGRRLLCPEVSPKKTVEGSLGGLAASILAALCCRMFLADNVSLLNCLVIGAGVNAMNQVGDLGESMVKRAFNVKDSGTLLPGHGGILDRIDSLLLAAPFLFYYLQMIVRL